MTPQITMLAEPPPRLYQSRRESWQKQRLVILMPCGESVPAKPLLSWLGMVMPFNSAYARLMIQGMEIGQAYSSAIARVLANSETKDWEYILTIEHDNIPTTYALVDLCNQMTRHPEFAAIGGLYYTKGERGAPQIWGDPEIPGDYLPQEPMGGLQECNAVGMGFTLFRIAMFHDERLRRPWFVTKMNGNERITQDIYFWQDAKQYGYRCAVDTDLRIGHYDFVEDIIW